MSTAAPTQLHDANARPKSLIALFFSPPIRELNKGHVSLRIRDAPQCEALADEISSRHISPDRRILPVFHFFDVQKRCSDFKNELNSHHTEWTYFVKRSLQDSAPNCQRKGKRFEEEGLATGYRCHQTHGSSQQLQQAISASLPNLIS